VVNPQRFPKRSSKNGIELEEENLEKPIPRINLGKFLGSGLPIPYGQSLKKEWKGLPGEPLIN